MMADIQQLVTDHFDIWTGAVKTQSTSGRGSRKKLELTGVKKLRELILELAVRGKLVPQDPNDESASILLEKISADKYRTYKENKIKIQKILQKINNDEKHFMLPKGWAYFRIGDYLEFQYGKSLPAKNRDESGNVDVYGSNGMVGKHTELLVEIPCIVIGRKGSAGALNKAKEPSWTTDVAYYLIPPEYFYFDYIFLMLKTMRLDTLGKGIKPGLNRNEAYLLVACLPPFAEQRRIVAKVDELMTLCDQLEQQTEESIAAHQTLVDTLLDALVNVEQDATGFADTWARIEQHFDILFTTEKSIDKLKQTILQLAVMGKLVPQDSNDEPASVLLERIAVEKARLVKEGKIKNQKPLPMISEEEKYSRLPKGWAWCRAENVADFIDPQPSHRTPPIVKDGVPYVGYKDIDHKNGINLLNSRKVSSDVYKEHRERYKLKIGDIIFGKIGTLGKPFFLTGPFVYCLSANLILIQPNLRAILPEYLAMYLDSPQFLDILGSKKTNSTHGVFGIKKARLVIIPFPPLKEQHRIVAKVGELIAISDKLKDQLASKKTIQQHLADAFVEQAISNR